MQRQEAEDVLNAYGKQGKRAEMKEENGDWIVTVPDFGTAGVFKDKDAAMAPVTPMTEPLDP